MILTELEAITKWCPHVRMSAFVRGAAVNRYFGGAQADERNCIASRCSQWRWAEKRNPGFPIYADPKSTPIPEYVADDKRGYCGLAGKPITDDPYRAI